MLDLSWLLQKLFALHGGLPRRFSSRGRAWMPIHMLMEVTYRCNLRCNFCQYLDIIDGTAKPYGPSERDISLEHFKRCIDELPRRRLISFAGGETLVRKDFLEMLTYASRTHRTHVITNGTLISETIGRAYSDLAPKRPWNNGLVLLEVSLEGDEKRHDRVVQRPGSWRRAVEAVRLVRRFRDESGNLFPRLSLKLVITRDTVPAMVEFMDLAKSLGADVVNFLAEHDLVGNAQGGKLERLHIPQPQPVGVDPGFLRHQLLRCFERAQETGVQLRLTPYVPIDEFVRHYTSDRELSPSEYVCDGAWSRLAVAADGRYAPMCHYAATGDMRVQTIDEVWNGERFRSFREDIKRQGIYPGCSGCCNLRYVGPKAHGLEGVSDLTLAANEDRDEPAEAAVAARATA